MEKVERATDIETALYWIGNLRNPCGFGLIEGYVHSAKMALRQFKEPEAISLLEEEIQLYSIK